jgi:hypothetical protein
MHVALAAGVPADRLVLHGNNKSDEELRAGLEAGSRQGRRRLLRRAGPDRAAPRRGAAAGPGAAADHPGRRGPHPRVRATGQDDSKFGFTVSTGAAAAPSSGPRLAGDRPGRHPRPHRQPGVPAGLASPRPPRWSPASPCRRACPSSLGGARRGLRGRRGGAHHPRVGRGVTAACRRRGLGARLLAEPGRAIVAAAAVTLYTVGTIKEIARRPHLRRRRRRHERQPPPGALRQRVRDVPPRCHPRRAARTGHGGRQALRVGRRAGARRPGARRPGGRRRPGHAGHRAPTGTRWGRTTTRSPVRRWCSLGRRARVVVRRETLDDLLGLDT